MKRKIVYGVVIVVAIATAFFNWNENGTTNAKQQGYVRYAYRYGF